MAGDAEWDPAKNAENQREHTISFEEAIAIFEGPVFSRIDDRHDYGEMREVSIGTVGGLTMLTIAHTDREGRRRIISARKATKREARLYYAYLQRALG